MPAMRRLIHYLKPYWMICALAVIMLIGNTTVDLVTPRLVQKIIDQGIARHNMQVVWTTAILMFGLDVMGAALMIGNTILAVRSSQRFGADVRGALFHKIQSLSFGNLDRLQTGELLVRLTSDISRVQMLVLMSLRMIIRAPLLLVGSMVLLVITSRHLAVIMLVVFPITFALVWVFAAKARPLFLEIQRRLDRLNNVLQENLSGVRVVKAFVRTDHENARFGVANDALTSQGIRVMRFFSFLMPTIAALIQLGTVAAIWLGGVYVVNDTVTVGQVVAFVNYMVNTLFPLSMLGMMVNMISSAEASAQRIVEVLQNEPQVQDAPNGRILPDMKGRVALENVTFSYNGNSQEPVLNGVNLQAQPGETIAILGATGAGKSSLINLIPRFYDVTSGRVTIDGEDVRELDLGALRSQIGIALQEAVLFSGTVRDNIRYGRPEASDEEVVAAAKAAQAHDFIMSFPEGYDTMIGQRGVNLSGGQKQRLAIARALLIKPRILIFDDSTSAVDVETAARLQETLAQIATDATRFIVAQRVSSVLNADKIVVLDRGQVAAIGTHAELLASSPIYREIYQSQLGNGETAHV